MTLDMKQLDPRIKTIRDADAMATIMAGKAAAEERVDVLGDRHPKIQAINEWYLWATDVLIGRHCVTGYEEQLVTIPDGAKVNEQNERVCRECGRVLTKRPGRGRWPVKCRDGEGCKVDESDKED